MPFDLADWLCFWPFPRGRARRWVRAGDASRDAGHWAQAAAHYRRAVAIEPRRRSILVQLGHADKEAGAAQLALEAYRRASALRGKDGDAPFHLGQLACALGDMATARQGLDQALRENPVHAGARQQRLALAHLPAAIGPAARARATDFARAEQARAGQSAPSATLFDISDLLAYFRHARLPTGIQRVQIEIVGRALTVAPHAQACIFVEDPGRWAIVPTALLQSLSALSVISGDTLDPVWLETLEVLTGVLDCGLTPSLGSDAWLVNLGTSYQHRNYFLHIRDLQRRHGLRYVPFAHDLIPVVARQYCVEGLTQDFLGWSSGVFDHAFAFLTNSCSTGRDLQKVAAQYGHALDEERIAVIALDADARRAGEAMPDGPALAHWGLTSGGYVLFVSTIEARKNHLLALQAWATQIDRHGHEAVPDLICVGQKGWLNDAVYRLLAGDPVLAAKVRILSGLSDEDIALLYRHCSFTLYPSHYEGWGLPVTESLCHGKVPVISRNSSLPEAGGDLALYIDPDDSESLVSVAGRLWFDTAWRAEREARIAAQFRPRTWDDLTHQVIAALRNFDRNLPPLEGIPPPTVRPDRLYRLTRLRLTRPIRHAGDAERWRDGTAWWPPQDHGCQTTAEGGALRINVQSKADRLWCCLRLQGLSGEPLEGCVTVNGREHRFALSEGTPRWIALPIGTGALHLEMIAHTLSSGTLTALVLSQMAVVETMPVDVIDLARALARHGDALYRLLRDVHEVLRGQEIGRQELEACLAAMESGALTEQDLIASWAPPQAHAERFSPVTM